MNNETSVTSYDLAAFLILEGLPLLDMRPEPGNPRRLLFIFRRDDEFEKAIDTWKAGAMVPAKEYAEKIRHIKGAVNRYFTEQRRDEAARASRQGQ